MKTLDYYQVMSKINKGTPTDKVQVYHRKQWISWDKAVKVLQGLDFNNVKYRIVD